MSKPLPPSLFHEVWFRVRWPLVFAVLLGAALLVANGMIEDWGRLSNGFSNLFVFVNESLWPPDWSVMQPQAYPACERGPGFEFTCSTAWLGMIETLKIAFVATVLGCLLSLPMALFAARNLNPTWLTFFSRAILAACRSLPSIVWAIFFVILIGLGPFAGILAMTVYTVGYLGKLQYEAIEGLEREPLDASRAMGHGWLERNLGVVLPEAANGLISQAIFMFEYNVRHGTVIGIVGAGGIGYYINLYLRFLQYDKVMAYLIIIFVVVLVLDQFSILARSLFTDEPRKKRASWWSVLVPAGLLASGDAEE
ncbi:MAG: phosphonate ABC transporter, permease protein PhnE [Candidatus Poseidoniaceae archaeon]|nr:phosphonate ABC transporter, permease protein PhnE [Candidatus Poseidoniaceae archaeon]